MSFVTLSSLTLTSFLTFHLQTPTSSTTLPDLSCTDPFQCANLVDDTPYNTIKCDGWFGCTESSFTNISKDLLCRSAYGCFSSSIHTLNINAPESNIITLRAMSYASAANINQLTFEVIDCYGELSCSLGDNILITHVDINNQNGIGNNIRCFASKSCAHSIINFEHGSGHDGHSGHSNGNFDSELQISGPFGLYNSSVTYDLDHGEFHVIMDGLYAAYLGEIICDISGDASCLLTCFGSGCVGLTLNCVNSGTTCNVDCNHLELNHCPISSGNGNIININGGMVFPHVTQIMDGTVIVSQQTVVPSPAGPLYQLIPLDKNEYNQLFAAEPCDNLCDGADECLGMNLNINLGSLCCVGRRGCFNTDVDFGANAVDIFCDAESSCEKMIADIESPNTIIFATALYSLRDASLNFINSQNINDNMVNIKLICSGNKACHNMDTNDFNTVVCDSVKSCQKSTIKNTQNVYSFARDGLFKANVVFRSNEAIWSDNKLNVYLMSYLSGNYMSVDCDSYTVCTIFCEERGCELTEQYVDLSKCSQCVLSPFAPTPIPTKKPTNKPTRKPTPKPTVWHRLLL